MMSERLGRISFWLTFVGFNVCFLPMHLTGLLGMPRRVFTYPDDLGWDALNMISTVGSLRGRGRVPGLRLGPAAAETGSGRHPAQSVEGRHARMEPRHPRGSLGRALHPVHHDALSAVGAGRHRRAHGRGPLLPARRRRRAPGDAGHQRHRRAADPDPAGDGGRMDHDLRGDLHRWRVHLPDVPHVSAGDRQRCGGAGAASSTGSGRRRRRCPRRTWRMPGWA